MATSEEIIIDLKLNVDASTKSLTQLEQELVSLKDALKNTKVGSEEFKKLQTEVIKADSRIKNLNKSIEGLDTEAMAGEIGKLAGGISASFTAVAAVIGNGSEEFEKFTKNIVTGIAVTQGLKGAQEAWTASAKIARQAQIAWNAAMAANPIGLVVTAIAALTAGIYLLTKAFADNRTEEEKNIELLKSNSEAAKAFNAQVESITDNLNASALAYATATNSIEEMEIKLQDITDTETEQIAKIKETSKVRQEELDKQLASISDFERLTNPEEAFKKVQKINADKIVEQDKLDKSILDLAKTSANKLSTLQDALNKKIETSDKNRLAQFNNLQNQIIQKIREVNNKILSIELDTYGILNNNRAGLADYEIELLERNYQLSKKIRKENNRDLIKDLKEQAIEQKYQIDELISDEEKLSLTRKDNEETAYKQRQDQLIGRRDAELITQQEYYDGLKKLENEHFLILANIEAQKINRQKELNSSVLNNRASLNNEIRKLEKTLNNEELAEAAKLEAKKKEIKKDFDKQIFKDTIAVNERLELVNLQILQKQTSNQKDAYMVEVKLMNSKFNNIIDLEEELALRRSSIQFFQEERNKQAIVDRLKLIKNASTEELKLISSLEAEISLLTQEQAAELFRIKREFGDKRIQLEKDILKSQISSLQSNLDRELRLREGNFEKVAELTKRRLDSEQALELMAAEEKYKADLLLAVNNSEKQLEITQEFENTKALIEDDYRQKKIKADLDGYKQVAEIGEQLFSDFQQILANQTNARIEEELKIKNDAFDAEIEALEGAVDAGIETEESKQDKLDEIERKREKAEKKAAYDKAKAEKEAALVQAAIQTALAVLEASPVVPLMITAGILGAAQAAVIASQPLPQLRKGGKINGPKHEQGGVPLFQNGSQIAEVEGGELIMTSGVANSPALLAAASQINQLAGGVSFTNQPMGSTAAATIPMSVATIDEKSLASLVSRVTSIPIVNVATNTTKVDKKVKNIEAKSRF